VVRFGFLEPLALNITAARPFRAAGRLNRFASTSSRNDD
jgi:hypothetical protein